MISFFRIVVKCFCSAIIVSFCAAQEQKEIRDDFKRFFESFKVEGSFALYDLKNDSYVFCNEAQFRQPFIPASTFKICNSLIGLETGVIRDENFVIKWDGVVRQVVAWNEDQDLKTAFKNSTVPCYQELARRVGGKRMKYWLDKAKYGNADTSGGIDRFWLSGGLRITPEQQIRFLVRLYKNDLPFSTKSIDIVKRIMIAQDTVGYMLRAKTGLSEQDSKAIGWYVGYLETVAGTYFFATCVQSSDKDNPDFARSRKEITIEILKSLKLY
ncbi:MAG: class D beta-lactamase [Ignavibacteriales bacterium]|nr:class D beta-lactamase [Ignavibacteriales bacterium]